jgi:hypothetical protein
MKSVILLIEMKWGFNKIKKGVYIVNLLLKKIKQW